MQVSCVRQSINEMATSIVAEQSNADRRPPRNRTLCGPRGPSVDQSWWSETVQRCHQHGKNVCYVSVHRRSYFRGRGLLSSCRNNSIILRGQQEKIDWLRDRVGLELASFLKGAMPSGSLPKTNRQGESATPTPQKKDHYLGAVYEPDSQALE